MAVFKCRVSTSRRSRRAEVGFQKALRLAVHLLRTPMCPVTIRSFAPEDAPREDRRDCQGGRGRGRRTAGDSTKDRFGMRTFQGNRTNQKVRGIRSEGKY